MLIFGEPNTIVNLRQLYFAFITIVSLPKENLYKSFWITWFLGQWKSIIGDKCWLGFSRARKFTWQNFEKKSKSKCNSWGDLSCLQCRERRCCAWAGIENNEGRYNWKKEEAGICWDSLTQLLEVKETTKWVKGLGRLDVLREQVCPARDMRMVRQSGVRADLLMHV